ncbi:Ff.00g077860.m01.CDS01 [Fusarium sp. VM40]|nr:Ff.00g077860.m01.CDS01 [Fusarium sp. VM40]
MPSNEELLNNFLKTYSYATKYIKCIRIQWVDYSGVLRARFLPVSRCLEIAKNNETLRLAQNSMLIPISTAPRMFSIGDYHETWNLQPDWSSLRRCGFKNNHASVMSFVDQKDSASRFDKCPRTLLVHTLERLKKELGADVLVGFEIEFVLLDESNNIIKPLDRLNGYSRPAGLRGETLDLVEEIVDALKQSGINIHHFHAEAWDQLEIALAAEPALKAIDSLIMAQETIRTICIRRNLRATMTPNPTLTGPLSGLHLHLSLGKLEGGSGDNFIAGVLNHMGSLCAFGMANYDSYVRSVDDATGSWIGFGTDNRDLPVRKIDELHWEFRMMDGTSNPYLFVASVLLAALDGVKSETKLLWKDCKFFPQSMDERKRAEYGMDRSMPTTLKEALDHLKNDEDFKTWIPEDLMKWYISVKDKEVETFGKMSDEQRRLRFLEYF